jgi:hypothetical protein
MTDEVEVPETVRELWEVAFDLGYRWRSECERTNRLLAAIFQGAVKSEEGRELVNQALQQTSTESILWDGLLQQFLEGAS